MLPIVRASKFPLGTRIKPARFLEQSLFFAVNVHFTSALHQFVGPHIRLELLHLSLGQLLGLTAGAGEYNNVVPSLLPSYINMYICMCTQCMCIH